MVTNFASRCQEISQQKSQLCVGIDPSDELLRAWGLPQTKAGIRSFSLTVIEEAAKHVGFVKPQVAFFERFGAEGFEVLEEVIHAARESGLFLIADAKRGDIGSTMRGYARAWFSRDSKLFSDALTVSGYLGVSSLFETAKIADDSSGGIFVLCSTSNPEASEVQSAKIAEQVITSEIVRKAKACPSKNIGLVIGATKTLSEAGLGHILETDVELPILAPGFGAQGAKLGDIDTLFGASSHRVIASVSRSVLEAGREGLSKAILSSKNEL
ncbi:MAG: orotidine-5-phosphate decarboxylase [Actinomycetota bacterium]